MNGIFLMAFATLIGKEHVDEYRREDVLIFRTSLVAQKCKPKYVETQLKNRPPICNGGFANFSTIKPGQDLLRICTAWDGQRAFFTSGQTEVLQRRANDSASDIRINDQFKYSNA
jgi:hypothetical protein